ncbi:MAG: hypothetical protein ACYCQJ_15390 [Nitrososphaerales archaeon]
MLPVKLSEFIYARYQEERIKPLLKNFPVDPKLDGIYVLRLRENYHEPERYTFYTDKGGLKYRYELQSRQRPNQQVPNELMILRERLNDHYRSMLGFVYDTIINGQHVFQVDRKGRWILFTLFTDKVYVYDDDQLLIF